MERLTKRNAKGVICPVEPIKTVTDLDKYLERLAFYEDQEELKHLTLKPFSEYKPDEKVPVSKKYIDELLEHAVDNKKNDICDIIRDYMHELIDKKESYDAMWLILEIHSELNKRISNS